MQSLLSESWPVIALGFALGARHATDADHLVAVAAIVARVRHTEGGSRSRSAWVVGALWGLGHSLTVFVVGVAVILLHVAIPERVALGFELLVGAALVALGVLNIAGIWNPATAQVHAHEHGADHHAHEEDPHPHAHPHVHAVGPAWLKQLEKSLGLAQAARSFGLGLLHGLAGSAAIALLVLATIPGPMLGAFYLAVFGVGTVLGMMCMTAALGYSFSWLGAAKLQRWTAPATGLLSVAFGGWTCVRMVSLLR